MLRARSVRPVLVLSTLAALGALGGCDDAPATSEVTPLVRDSAGVRIVTHPPGPFADTVADEPVLTIGREGEPDYELFRVTAVVPLASGRVVVANAGTRELRVFDGRGEHLRTVGGGGEGPNEFGFLSTVWRRPGDTLVAMDPNRRRLVVFDSAGAFVRGEPYDDVLTDAAPQGSFCVRPGLMGLTGTDGRVVRGWACAGFEGSPGVRGWPLTLTLVRGGVRDSVGVFSSGRIWERPDAEDPGEMYDFLPFTARFAYAFDADGFVTTRGAGYSLTRYDAQGRPVVILREDTVPPAVDEGMRAAYRAERDAAEDPHPDDVPFPVRMPAWQGLLISAEGEVWARHAPLPGDSLQRWSVFSAGGEAVRRMVLPDARVESVRDGRIYAIRTDDLGIQRVVAYEVPGRKSGSQAPRKLVALRIRPSRPTRA